MEHSVIRWVTHSLRPVLDRIPSEDVDIQLYLPMEDPRANRKNEYNSVRDQIMRQLFLDRTPKSKIALAGSSDPESPNNTLDTLFEGNNKEFRTFIKCESYPVSIVRLGGLLLNSS